MLYRLRPSLLPTLLVAGLGVLAAAPASGQPAYPPAAPPQRAGSFVSQPTAQSGVVARPTAPPASYAPAGVNPNGYAPGYAPYYGGPYYNGAAGGALTGAANAINAQGELMNQYQGSLLMHEDVKRSKIDTQRKQFDEWMYERAMTPTLEDNRRRDQYEQLRRALNDPPPAEVWDGSALNRILAATQQVLPPGSPGPTIPLNPQLATQLNLTTGTTSTGVGVLKNGPKLRWPLPLQDDAFDGLRTDIDSLMKTAYDQVTAGDVDGKVLRQLKKDLDQMDALLLSLIEQMTPSDNVHGKRYVRELRETVTALAQPDASSSFMACQSFPAPTVGDLVQTMSARGLTFAPAQAGAAPAYNAVYTAMVAYYTALTQPAVR